MASVAEAGEVCAGGLTARAAQSPSPTSPDPPIQNARAASHARFPTLLLFLVVSSSPLITTPTPAMFARAAARSLAANSRTFSSSAARQSKVAVLGAGGGIGQPLSLLLKLNPHVTELSLYDIRGAPGVAADVSHIDTKSEVCFYSPRSRYV